ncbi:unnamed protein product [Heterobilharzia americana]|nr:unnamed protein product [Heterobilharzia americana]
MDQFKRVFLLMVIHGFILCKLNSVFTHTDQSSLFYALLGTINVLGKVVVFFTLDYLKNDEFMNDNVS